MYKLLLLVACLGVSQLHAQSLQRINDAKALIKAAIEADQRLGPGFVRVVFHDCVGGCDGCINLCQPGNAGIRQYVDRLEELWVDNGFDTDFSRADFWVLASIAALERAVLVPDNGAGGGGQGGNGKRKRRSLKHVIKNNEIKRELDEILKDLKDLETVMNDVKKDPQRGGGRPGGGRPGGGGPGPEPPTVPETEAPPTDPEPQPVTVGGLTLTFRTGRQDCPSSPDSTALDNLPNSAGGSAEYKQWFRNEFGGISDREIVALMGAHTLGRAHREHSGYDGPWVANENRLDNTYYADLLRPWHQVQEPPQRQPACQRENPFLVNPAKPLFQWRGPPTLMMLNTDMALGFDIQQNDAAHGLSSCDAVRPAPPGSPRRGLCGDSDTKHFVEEFAADNAQWLRDFSGIYQKVIDHEQTGGR